MSDGDKFTEFIVKKLSQFRDAMADNIMKQLSWELAHPVGTVAKDWPHVIRISQIVRPIALQVNWLPSQNPLFHKTAHFKHFKRELIVVADRHLAATAVSELD